MTAGDVRRDGLREAVTALREELFSRTSDGQGKVRDHWRGRDFVEGEDHGLEQAVDALGDLLDAVPDVPPDPPAAAPCVTGACLYLRDLDEPVALRVEWLLRDGRQGFAEFSDRAVSEREGAS